MNRNVLIRISTDPPGRIWSGVGDLYIPADAIETEEGARYLGGGAILDGLGEVDQLINGTADRVELSLSGVSGTAVKMATEDAEAVKGALMDIGVITFDNLWQTQEVTWQAQYRVDKIGTGRQPNSRTITLSLGSDDTGRSRTINAFWTPADQARRSPDDRIFDFVPDINAGTSRLFGPSQ